MCLLSYKFVLFSPWAIRMPTPSMGAHDTVRSSGGGDSIYRYIDFRARESVVKLPIFLHRSNYIEYL